MKKVLVLGTALIDNIIIAEQPLQPQVCNKAFSWLSTGGSMCNVAHNLGILGYPVDFLTVYGNDVYAEIIKKELTTSGVNCFGPIVDNPTPVFTSVTSPKGTVNVSGISDEFFLDANFSFHYEDYDVLVTDNDDQQLLTKILTANPDIALIANGWLPLSTLAENLEGIVLNRHELYSLVGHDNYNAVARNYPASWIVVSLDRQGCYASHKNNVYLKSNKNNSPNGFPLGCGDVLTAGLLYRLWNGDSFAGAIDFGHAMAEAAFQSRNSTIDSSTVSL